MLGMARWLGDERSDTSRFVAEQEGAVWPPAFTWQACPGEGPGGTSHARSHLDFLDDPCTWQGLVKQVLGLPQEHEDLELR